MARLRYNLVEVALSSDITSVTTTIPLTEALVEGGVDIPTVAAPDTLAIRVGAEIMSVTSYTTGTLTATASRGQEGTVAVEHFGGDAVKHVITKDDFQGGSGFNFTIAASDSSTEDQSKADFVCVGTADHSVFQSIIDTYGTGEYLQIAVAAGTYAIDGQIDVDCAAGVTLYGNIHSDRASDSNRPVFDKQTAGDFSIFAVTGSVERTVAFVGLLLDSGNISDGAVTSPLIECGSSSAVVVDHCYIDSDGSSAAPAIGVIATNVKLTITDSLLISNTSTVLLTAAVANVEVSARRSDISGSGRAFSAETLGGGCSFLFEDCPLVATTGPAVRIDGNSSVQPIVRVLNCRITTGGEALYLTDIFSLEVSGGTAWAATASLIRLETVDQGIIAGVSSVDCDHGIWALNCDNLLIERNNFIDYGTDIDATYSGILLDGDTNNCSIIDNHLRTATGGNKALYGIRVDDSTCDNNYIKNNDVFGSAKTNGNEISDAGTGTRGQDVLMFSLGDETTVIGATGEKLSIRWPFNFCLTKLRASLRTASGSAGPFTIDVEDGGVSVMTTNLLIIDDTELTSLTAVQPSITDNFLAEDAIVTFDVDDAGDGGASGAKVTVYGWRV